MRQVIDGYRSAYLADTSADADELGDDIGDIGDIGDMDRLGSGLWPGVVYALYITVFGCFHSSNPPSHPR